jgi:hypothetical protein
MIGIDLGLDLGSLSGGDTVASKDYKRMREHSVIDVGRKIGSAAEGAREAGLHPLFALGGGAGSGTGVVPVGGSKRGISGQASTKLLSSQQTEFNNANTARVNAETDLIRQQIEESKARMADTMRNANQDGSVPDSVTTESVRVPSASTTSTGTAAHPEQGAPMFQKYNTGLGFPLWLPFSPEGPAEGADAILLWPITALKNSQELNKWLNSKIAQGYLFTKKEVDYNIGRMKRIMDQPRKKDNYGSHTIIKPFVP